jgi:hypothetical protein
MQPTTYTDDHGNTHTHYDTIKHTDGITYFLVHSTINGGDRNALKLIDGDFAAKTLNFYSFQGRPTLAKITWRSDTIKCPISFDAQELLNITRNEPNHALILR